MKVQLVTPYCVSHLQRYTVTLRSNVTSVDPPLTVLHNTPLHRGTANQSGAPLRSLLSPRSLRILPPMKRTESSPKIQNKL